MNSMIIIQRKTSWQQYILSPLRFAFVLLVTTFAVQTVVNAQGSPSNIADAEEFRLAKQQFNAGNYHLAYPFFNGLHQKLQGANATQQEILLDEVQFYTIACELMMDNYAAPQHANLYLEGYHPAIFKGQLSFYLGCYQFRRAAYESADMAFSQASIAHLSNEQVADMQFEHGYSLFVLKKYTAAKPLFASVRQLNEHRFFTDANYYFGIICFGEQKYRDALAGFEMSRTNPKYQPLVPYYIASILYMTGQREKGMALAEQALYVGNKFYANELNQLVGHGYFEKKEYAKALPFLDHFIAASPKVRREDYYELAYSQYMTKNWADAIMGFKPLSSGQDSLSQHAMYLLGDAYLKTNQKANAKTAFQFCATNTTNTVFREQSMFAVGKLAFELGLDNESTLALKKFITLYPTSSLKPEANDLLVSTLANTSNYREALQLFDGLPNKSENSQRVLPRILYNRAQEEINDQHFNEAMALIDRGLTVPYNTAVKPLLHFWKAELLYQKGDIATTLFQMNEYLKTPIVKDEANLANAHYTIAYCLMYQENYSGAQKEWEGLKNNTQFSKEVQEDVLARLSDCYYMQKAYPKAAPIYTSLIDRSSSKSDYAMYQLAMIVGAQSNTSLKISTLQNIEKQFVTSTLVPLANMEIAKTLLSDEKYREAIPFLQKITAGKMGDDIKPAALLKLGLAYYNLDNNAEALTNYRLLLSKYPNAPEGDEAIDNVRSIFIEDGKPAAFISFVESVGRKVDKNVADSLTYTAAELPWSDGKKDQALQGFTEYLQQFPDGRYAIPAMYNSAEIYREKKDIAKAIPLYEALAAKAPNKYAEVSMLQAARLLYFEEKAYPKAAIYYQQLKAYATRQENKLEAMRGLLRCQFYSGDFIAAFTNANELLQQSGIGNDDKVFAYLVVGKNAQTNKNFGDAIRSYQQVIGLNKAAYGAEARFEIANCLFLQGKLDESEKAAFEVIKKSGSYVDWVTRSYLLLGDIYFQQKDYFNAKATFKSVADNSTLPLFKTEALAKLSLVEKEENEKSKIGG